MPERVETYVARRTFTVGDRVVQPGDPVPEAEQWRRPQSWVNSGHLAVTFRDMTKEEIKARDKAVTAEAAGDPADLAAALKEMPVEDLREHAKEIGLKGYSKLRKPELIDLIAAG